VRPRIGITLTLDTQLRAGRRTWFADAAYATAVAAAGGGARFVASGAATASESAVDAALAEIDALVVPGGDDFPPPMPSAYPAHLAFRVAAPEQIAADLALVGAALSRGVPVLGVCYGMQLLTLASGGTLVYDIPHEVPCAAPHRLAPHERHRLSIAPGSRLAALFGGVGEIFVNSRHHQGVASPGRGLAASAHTEDGVIEAIESPVTAPFALGVQWHPEDMEPEHARAVYGGLVAAARARARA
jgi:putative glutamine amidotransferase